MQRFLSDFYIFLFIKFHFFISTNILFNWYRTLKVIPQGRLTGHEAPEKRYQYIWYLMAKFFILITI